MGFYTNWMNNYLSSLEFRTRHFFRFLHSFKTDKKYIFFIFCPFQGAGPSGQQKNNTSLVKTPTATPPRPPQPKKVQPPQKVWKYLPITVHTYYFDFDTSKKYTNEKYFFCFINYILTYTLYIHCVARIRY